MADLLSQSSSALDYLTEGFSLSAGSGNNKEEKQAFSDLFLKMEKNTKYIVRFLTEKNKFIQMNEHSFVPTYFKKNDGTKSPGNASFMCNKRVDCPICNTEVKDSKTGEIKKLRARKLLGIGVHIVAQKEKRGSKDIEIPVDESKIIMLPAGKSDSIWKQLFDNEDNNNGTLQNRPYVISKSGEGVDTVWSIQPLDKEDFDYDSVTPLDVRAAIIGSGRWKKAEDLQDRFEIRTGLEEYNTLANTEAKSELASVLDSI